MVCILWRKTLNLSFTSLTAGIYDLFINVIQFSLLCYIKGDTAWCLQPSFVIRTGRCLKNFFKNSVDFYFFFFQHHKKIKFFVFIRMNTFISVGFMTSLLKVFSHNRYVDIVSVVNEWTNPNFKYSYEYCLHFFLILEAVILLTRNGLI